MRLSGGQVDIELSLAREAYNSGDVATAARRIDAVLRTNPDHAGAHFGKGMILVAQGVQSEAIDSFNQALKYDPVSVEALAWATLTSLNLGQGEHAEAYARRLVQVQPANDRAYFLLSNSLSLQGRLEEALEAIERSLAIQPMEPDYVAGKAQLFAWMNWTTQAIEWYRKAARLRPSPDLSTALAELLVQEGQVREAISVLVKVAPESLPHELLAQAYTEAQEFEKAANHWSTAALKTTDESGLLVHRVQSEIYAGRLQVAEELIGEALQRDPNAVEFYQPLTTIRRMTGADAPIIEQMERLISRESLNLTKKRDLRYALGKAYNDLGEFRQAIHSYDEANRLACELSPICGRFDKHSWRAYTDLQIEFFNKERIRSISKEGLDAQSPLFILGMIRSGTTLTEQILSRHSKIQDGGETSFWPDHRGDVLNDRTRTFDAISARRLGQTYLRLLGVAGSAARYVTEKNPSNVFIAALIHCVYPNAKLLHIKRQPVDNLLSIWMTPMQTGLPFVYDKKNLVFVYGEYLRLTNHLERVLPPELYQTFHYEDVTSKPEATIGRILGFLDLEVEDACLHPETSNRTVRTPSYYQVRQPINTSSQEKWRLYEPWLGPFAELLDG